MSDTQSADTIHINLPGQYRQRRPATIAHERQRQPRGMHMSAAVRMSGTLAATLERATPTAVTDTTVLELPEPEVGLWYRLNSTWPNYLPVTSKYHAESLLRQIHDDEPWVTIALQPDPVTSTYFQILGTPDQLIAEAGFCLDDVEVSCRFTALPRDDREAHVGPHWYRLTVRESDILTTHDALGLLWPTLGGKFRRIGGIIPVWFT